MFAPVACLLALLIKMSGSGAVLYSHPRVGRSGRVFPCLKFRTMHPDADERLRSHLASDEGLAQQWAAHQKLEPDPRVTNIGRILRSTSLDELPQLINVLRGDMSLVGPRPVTESELTRYGSAAELYLQVRPGLTGIWQVSGRNLIPYGSRVQLDKDYVVNWRLTTDLWILARTPGAVLSRRGAS
jgi:exopolysaccharide production protein ExoY